MWEEILNLAIQNGLWAVLFLGLLIYQLRDSRNRETKYQNTIEKLNFHLDVVKDIKTDTENIKEDIAEIKSESLKKKQKIKSKV